MTDVVARLARLLVALALVVPSLLQARVAAAHEIGLSRGQYTAHPGALEARLTFDGDELGVATSEPSWPSVSGTTRAPSPR